MRNLEQHEVRKSVGKGKNECKIKPEYKKRIDNFFKYHDYNNCQRVYDEIIKFIGSKKWNL